MQVPIMDMVCYIINAQLVDVMIEIIISQLIRNLGYI